MFLMRFDLRAPGPTPVADLYAAALDMAAWGEQNGCLAIVLSQHHASEDGYLPSPVVMASAMAAEAPIFSSSGRASMAATAWTWAPSARWSRKAWPSLG